MLNPRIKHTAQSAPAAVSYLVRHGYINVRGQWLRGRNECAITEPLPSGRVRVIEGVAV